MRCTPRMQERSRVGLPLERSSWTLLGAPDLSRVKMRKTRAPLGVRGSTSPLFQLCCILRLIPSTYQGKRLPKSPWVMEVGPGLDWPWMARGMLLAACSPYWARFWGTGCWTLGGVIGVGLGFSFCCLPWMGMAFSSITGAAVLGAGGAGAGLGFSVARTFWLGGWSEGSGMTLVTWTRMAPPADEPPQMLEWKNPPMM